MSYSTATYAANPDPIEWSILQILEEEIAGNDPDTMLDLIDTFLNDTTTHINNVAQGIENREIKKIAISAHSIKSTAAIFGATTLATLCAEMERMANAGEDHAIPDILYLAHDEFARVGDALAVEREKWRKAVSR